MSLLVIIKRTSGFIKKYLADIILLFAIIILSYNFFNHMEKQCFAGRPPILRTWCTEKQVIEWGKIFGVSVFYIGINILLRKNKIIK